MAKKDQSGNISGASRAMCRKTRCMRCEKNSQNWQYWGFVPLCLECFQWITSAKQEGSITMGLSDLTGELVYYGEHNGIVLGGRVRDISIYFSFFRARGRGNKLFKPGRYHKLK